MKRSSMRYKKVVIIDGKRTPFAKSYGVLAQESTLSLSSAVVKNLITRHAIRVEDIDEVIWGTVMSSLKHPNLARDLVLFNGLPMFIPGFTLCKQCASSFQAIVSGADGIELGRYRMVLTGGVEHMSDTPIMLSKGLRQSLTSLSKAKTALDKLKVLTRLKKSDLSLEMPALREAFTNESMGESAEKMARINKISREEQDQWTLESHHKAEKAYAEHLFEEEVIALYIPSAQAPLERDTVLRSNLQMSDLARLSPSFDKTGGTITAGNATALTDGAAGCLLASKDYAESAGIPFLGYLIGESNVAVDPRDQLLIGPAIAIAKLLDDFGLTVEQIDLFEIHEAFAAQILSCLKVITDRQFMSKHGVSALPHPIPKEKINPTGGSLAFGHPLAATGARLVTTALHQLRRTNGQYAIVTACAAGGLAQALLLENPEYQEKSDKKNVRPNKTASVAAVQDHNYSQDTDYTDTPAESTTQSDSPSKTRTKKTASKPRKEK